MNKKDKALKLALTALMEATKIHASSCKCSVCCAVIVAQDALASEASEQPAQRDQEPVAITRMQRGQEILNWNRSQTEPPITVTRELWVADQLEQFYTSTPATKPMTNAQIGAVAADIWGSILIAPQSYQAFARAIEAVHGIKGDA